MPEQKIVIENRIDNIEILAALARIEEKLENLDLRLLKLETQLLLRR
jgi:hypothetical protein